MHRATIRLVALALALSGCAFIPRAAMAASTCGYAGGYPGDAAPKTQLAAWMAAGAIRSGLPAELPVMAALPESGLQNLDYGKDDSVGFFQMKLSIWNKGQYAGYPDNPDLQLKWFVDQAIAINQSRIARGQLPYGADSNLWGAWAADVEQPEPAHRGQYQPRLDEARGLIVGGCGLPSGSGYAGPDSIAPRVRLAGKRIQDAIRRGSIVVVAACLAEACVAGARGFVAVRGAAKVYRIRSAARRIPSGGSAKLRLRLKPALRWALRQSLRSRKRLRARVMVTAKDSSGNATSKRRTIILVHR